MGWFSKKEVKEEPKKDQPVFPSFKTDFPKYESQVNSNVPLPPQPMPRDAPMPPLKRPPTFDQPYKALPLTNNPSQDISQPPIRPRVMEQPFSPPPAPVRMPAPQYTPVQQHNPAPQRPPQRQMPPMPQRPQPMHIAPEPVKQGKTMFIKVDQYEDALDKIDKVMQQIQSAEETLRKIEDLRSQEVSELASWKKEIDDVKNKLKTVDRALFGR